MGANHPLDVFFHVFPGPPWVLTDFCHSIPVLIGTILVDHIIYEICSANSHDCPTQRTYLRCYYHQEFCLEDTERFCHLNQPEEPQYSSNPKEYLILIILEYSTTNSPEVLTGCHTRRQERCHDGDHIVIATNCYIYSTRKSHLDVSPYASFKDEDGCD